jgi:hypothetical protein
MSIEATIAALDAAAAAVTNAAETLSRARAEFLRSAPSASSAGPVPAAKVDEASYDLTLAQAAWRAGRISDNGMRAIIRKHGDRLGKKVLGRWRVSSTYLDKVMRASGGSVCSVCSVCSGDEHEPDQLASSTTLNP